MAGKPGKAHDHDPAESALNYIGGQIKAARLGAKLTQKQLAELVDLRPSYITALESGLHNPTARTLMKIADALGVESVTFFPGTPKGLPSDEALDRFVSVLERVEPLLEEHARLGRQVALILREIALVRAGFSHLMGSGPPEQGEGVGAE